jgi:hypothetical protein
VVNGFDLPELLSSEDLHHRLVLCIYVSINDDDSDGLHSPEDRSILALSSKENKLVLTKETLAKRWGISLKAADTTIQATTQRGMLSFLRPIERRLHSSQPHLGYNVIKNRMYSDTMFSKIKSLHLNVAAQVWSDSHGYSLFYPIKSKALAWTTVSLMVSDMNAIAKTIITNGATMGF